MRSEQQNIVQILSATESQCREVLAEIIALNGIFEEESEINKILQSWLDLQTKLVETASVNKI